MPLDDAFWPALWSLSMATGTRPETFLAVWFAESGLQTSIRNPATGCIGLNQTCPKEIGGPGFPNDDADGYAALPASDQLAWIAPQVIAQWHLNGGPFVSAARYYQANFLPATLATTRRVADIIAGKDGPFAKAYAANVVLDMNRDGAITLDDLAAWVKQSAQQRGSQTLDDAIARTYAERPSSSPWASARLVFNEPRAGGTGGGGGVALGFALVLGLAWLRGRA